MSLIELLTGSVVFTAAAGSSLQLWALAGAAAVAEQRQQERLEQVEAALARAETSLRGLAPSAGDCTTATAQLQFERGDIDPEFSALLRNTLTVCF